MSDYYIRLSKQDVFSTHEVNELMNIDYDSQGNVVGVEVLGPELFTMECDGREMAFRPRRSNAGVRSRVAVMESLPWVTRMDDYHRCDGFRWNQMPLYAVNDKTKRDEYRCTKRGHWAFTAVLLAASKDRAYSGTYCWQHLVHSGVFGTPVEKMRAETWWAEHPGSGEGG